MISPFPYIRTCCRRASAAALVSLVLQQPIFSASSIAPETTRASAQDINSGHTSCVDNFHCNTIDPHDFIIVKEFSGSNNYYTIIPDTNNNGRIHAFYTPPDKVVRLGCQFPDTCRVIKKVSWDWRIISPPRDASENIKTRNDSGASIYCMFGDRVKTQIIKYVYSSSLPAGTILKKDPFPPLQRMFVVVKSSVNNQKPGTWVHVNAEVVSDFKKLYGEKLNPQLRGIGIMSDGDETGSVVEADYRNFSFCKLE